MKVRCCFNAKLRNVAVVLVTVWSAGYGAAFFSDQGSSEIGGSIAVSSASTSGVSGSATTLQLTPVINFFPARYFLVGPAIQYQGQWAYGSSQTQLNLGINLGIVYPINNSKALFYLTSGVQYVDFASYSETGYSIPINIGWKIPIYNHLCISFGPSVSFTTVSGSSEPYEAASSQTITMFQFLIGFSGLLY